MSDFFRQLVARHQGHVALVQPLLPNRFGEWGNEPAAEPLLGEGAAETAAVPRTVTRGPNLSSVEAVAPSVSPIVSPNPDIGPARLPVTPPSRLETVTQWIHQVERVSTVTAASDLKATQPPDTPQKPPAQISPPVMPPALQPQAIASSFLPVPNSAVEPPARSTAPAILPSPPSLSVIPIAPAPSTPPPTLPPTPLPSIRVTIGRVEIRANPATTVTPPAPRRISPSQRPALSLDAYLHQRSRRS
jgi:hypothetical protein